MKVTAITMTGMLAAALGCSSATGTGVVSLEDSQARESYAIGVSIASGIAQEIGTIDREALLAGLSDGLDGRPRLDEGQLAATFGAMDERQRSERQQALDEQAVRNRAEGEAFVAEFAAEDGVTRLDDGVLYRVVVAGDGPIPGPQDQVRVHYAGRLVDGTAIDSSREHQAPATFQVDQVIPGFTSVLQQMPVGSTWEVVIPPALAYGAQGAGPIGPDTTLVFELELLETTPPPA